MIWFSVQHFLSPINTIKPILRGHLLDKEKVVFYDRRPLQFIWNILWQDMKNMTF
jgi:hypothetical protein